MKKTLTIVSGVLAVASLAACNKQAEPSAPEAGATTMSGNKASMPMAGAMKHGMTSGTVTAIDAANGTITLDHGPMNSLGWSAMTMAFTAKPEQLSGIAVGDKVDFEIDWDGKTATVTKIARSGS